MPDFNIGSVLAVIDNAIAAVKTANRYIDEMKDTGVVLSSDSEEAVDERIKQLDALYEGMKDRVQNKLRGTGG